MRHRNHSHRLSQKPHHAKMMLRNMLTSLLLHESIRTTRKRATILKPLVDKILTIGKTDRPALAIRRINQEVTHRNACRKVMEVFVQRYEGRTSGFTRMKPVGMRVGDGAMLVDLMLVEGKEVLVPEVTTKKAEKKTVRKTAKKSVATTPSDSAATPIS